MDNALLLFLLEFRVLERSPTSRYGAGGALKNCLQPGKCPSSGLQTSRNRQSLAAVTKSLWSETGLSHFPGVWACFGHGIRTLIFFRKRLKHHLRFGLAGLFHSLLRYLASICEVAQNALLLVTANIF